MQTAANKNRKLLLKSDTSTRSSETGSRIPSKSAGVEVWANVQYRWADERNMDSQQKHVQEVNITINWREGVNNTYWLEDESTGEVFDVMGIKPRGGRRHELILQTELRN
jgi:head-tail adaptor